jgi:hypothetical protein
MFAQRPRKGAPTQTSETQMRNGILAGFANAWLRAHKDDDRKQDIKLAEAARHLRGPWFGSITRAKLKTAREIVSREPEGLSRETAEWFEKFFDEASAMFGPKRVFPLMVRYFNEHPAGKAMGILKTTPIT